MGEVELYKGDNSQIASKNNLPTAAPRHQDNFDAKGVTKLVLDEMLGQFAIVPLPGIEHISVLHYEGDKEMLSAVRGRIEGGNTLKLSGKIPFKAGNSGGYNNFGGGSFSFGGSIHIGSMSGGSVSMSSGGRNMTIINGREVDNDRAIKIVIVVPPTLDLKVKSLIGEVGITDYLDGELDFSPTYHLELFADGGVKSLTGDISGSAKATLSSVSDETDVTISGSGKFEIQKVSGRVAASISGSGKVIIGSGESTTLRASVSGSGKIEHNGRVTGNGRMRLSGSGKIIVKSCSSPDVSITGSGKIIENGTTHAPRW